MILKLIAPPRWGGKGRAICTIKHLAKLRDERRSVVIAPWIGRLPAAVVINWQGSELWRLMRSGLLHEYKPLTKRRKP